jgi:1-acyl-sn-glycerol-3-phosphate acyltransferase
MTPIPVALHDTYETAGARGAFWRRSPVLATMRFYPSMIRTVLRAARAARRGVYGNEEWNASSLAILRGLEAAGCRVSVTGMREFAQDVDAAVFIGNHMSTLETFVLPVLINPVKPVTFVVKPSLIGYPVFGAVMRSRNPVVVSRDNPRQDLVTVLEQGRERLRAGVSLILFPQTTRTTAFDPQHFNSLGVKLARGAGVPVVPVALKTDAWANGRMFKDFGPIHPERRVHIAFGEAFTVAGSGREEHERIVSFIGGKLAQWSSAV